jgi:hypothetical protein
MSEFISPEAIQLKAKFALANLMRSKRRVPAKFGRII